MIPLNQWVVAQVLRKRNDMKLYEYKETYEGHTSTLSNINRSIAFVGIAVVWIFKKN